MTDDARGETPPEDPPVDQESTPDEQPFDLDRAMTTIRALRQEAKQAKVHLKELETLRTERETARQAQLTKEEQLASALARAEAERDHAQQERQDALNRHSVLQEALRQGAVDADAVYRLLDWNAVEYGSDGEPKNVSKAITALLKEKPYLAGQTPTANVGNPATRAQQAGKPVFTRSQVTDSRFYAANRDAILDAMRDGRLVDG